ncbi:MAG: hypothetical protein U9R72_14950 [Chloroflexota bacterium]|nr:hypothetical protein [Chloroflexota bacterium]
MMAQPTRQWITRAVVGIAVGAALGVAIGWWLWPVTYTNTSPDVLREDYQDEYVLMTATAYEVEGDRERARERLALLDPEEPSAPVVGLAERLIEQGGSEEDIVRLARLAEALGVTSPALMPYLQS